MNRWSFAAAWAAVGWAGFLAGFVVAFLLVGVAVSLVTTDVDAVMSSPVAFGVGITIAFALGGLAQGTGHWLLLRRRMPTPATWVLASGLGYLVFVLVWLALRGRVPELVDEIVHNAAGGLVLGYLQWRWVLRDRVPGSRAWIAVPAVALPVAGLLNYALLHTIGNGEGNFVPVAMAAAMLVHAGGAFRILAREEPPRRVEPVVAVAR